MTKILSQPFAIAAEDLSEQFLLDGYYQRAHVKLGCRAPVRVP
jgi:hypothetical protein